jgi:hypothetical protein
MGAGSSNHIRQGQRGVHCHKCVEMFENREIVCEALFVIASAHCECANVGSLMNGSERAPSTTTTASRGARYDSMNANHDGLKAVRANFFMSKVGGRGGRCRLLWVTKPFRGWAAIQYNIREGGPFANPMTSVAHDGFLW